MSNEGQVRSHSAVPEGPQFKSGWLMKQSSNLLRTFRKRFLVLECKHLYIYSDESRHTLKAVLNFDQIETKVYPHPKDSGKLILSFPSSSTSMILKGKKEELVSWEKSLSAAISLSRPSDLFHSLALEKKFWKFFYISESEFCKNAQTGDVVLFKGKSKLSTALRGILNCDFDHIAVIYLLNGYIYLFESTRTTGVILTSWEEFVQRKWFEMYQRVAYRKLIIERNERFFEMSHEFVVEAEGKPYKLMKFLGNGDEGYFCSELVAEFYRKTGVIYQNMPAKKFMPKHFVSYELNIVQGEMDLLKDIRFQ